LTIHTPSPPRHTSGVFPRVSTHSARAHSLSLFSPDRDSILWRDRDSSDLYLAEGIAREFLTATEARNGLAEFSARNLPFAPRCFGYIMFDPLRHSAAEWNGFAVRRFVLPAKLTRIDSSGYSETVEFAESSLPTVKFATEYPPLRDPMSSFGPARWREAVQAILRRIDHGELAKCVLSERVSLPLSAPLDFSAVCQALAQANPRCSIFAWAGGQGSVFFGASPERLFQVSENILYVESLAGTRARGNHAADDESLSCELQASDKERREQEIVTEFLANRLQQLCSSVAPSSAPSVLRLSNVQHLQTSLAGTLRSDMTLDKILDLLHPTPAVCGAPAIPAAQAIRELEPHARGLYAGAIGWLETERAEFAVAIRSALGRGQVVHLYGGAGIVADSDPTAEYAECLLKMETIRRALS
jgi:isochorismate synthase